MSRRLYDFTSWYKFRAEVFNVVSGGTDRTVRQRGNRKKDAVVSLILTGLTLMKAATIKIITAGMNLIVSESHSKPVNNRFERRITDERMVVYRTRVMREGSAGLRVLKMGCETFSLRKRAAMLISARSRSDQCLIFTPMNVAATAP